MSLLINTGHNKYNNFIFVCDICTKQFNNLYIINIQETLAKIKIHEIKKNNIYFHNTENNQDYCIKCYNKYSIYNNKQDFIQQQYN